MLVEVFFEIHVLTNSYKVYGVHCLQITFQACSGIFPSRHVLKILS